MRRSTYVTLSLIAALVACGPTPSLPSTQAATETTATDPGGSQTAVYEATLEATAEVGAELPEEAILILSPAGGSRLVGQAHVEGAADSTFEQNLVIQIVLLGETEQVLAQTPSTIQAELGQRGPFAADLSFAFAGPADEPGEVRVFASSPRDGGITHLATSPVTLGAAGEADVRSGEAHPERIAISAPVPAQEVRGGVAHVEGVGLASFEQTLVVEIHDVAGVLIGSAPITVQALDLGLPGPFSVDVAYAASSAGPGRVTVRDPSPAFGQTIHLASVEIRIEP